MRRSVLFALLATALVLLTTQGARSDDRGHPRVIYYPVYYPVSYSAPSSYDRSSDRSLSTSSRPALAVVEVGAYDKVGFNPKSITVMPGTIVRWVNYGKEGHTVTSDDGYFDSGTMSPGGTFFVLFYKPGTYHYTCKPHGKMGMTGTVVVRSDVPGSSGY
jgi:plastocyanin